MLTNFHHHPWTTDGFLLVLHPLHTHLGAETSPLHDGPRGQAKVPLKIPLRGGLAQEPVDEEEGHSGGQLGVGEPRVIEPGGGEVAAPQTRAPRVGPDPLVTLKHRLARGKAKLPPAFPAVTSDGDDAVLFIYP